MSELKILVGCDPEVFLKNPNTGEYVSAHGMIKGTKREPYSVRNGAVQVDGCALEINITPAADSKAFVGNVKDVMEQMRKMVPGYNLAIDPVAVFEQEYFDLIPAEAKELGCEPDFNAYTGKMNIPPKTDRPFRTAAGHVHVSWGEGTDINDTNHFADCCAVVKQLDWYLGMPSLMWDSDEERRSLYGKAGSFRPKHYGVEYRTPSNAWLTQDHLMKYVYDQTVKAVNDLYKGHKAFAEYPVWAQQIIDASTPWYSSTGARARWYDQTGSALPLITESKAKKAA